ncbi:MAG: SLBB domain-containing protein [Anaerolineae bacterium]|nr:SLBB domain-containing protein [Anaerolineae bacterium]
MMTKSVTTSNLAALQMKYFHQFQQRRIHVQHFTFWGELRPQHLKETRVILQHSGMIDPREIQEYLAVGGYSALAKALAEMSPESVIDEVLRAGLRGRGGAGFPTAKKWQFTRNSPGLPRYLVCNGNEGDPGAYMNRLLLETNPHSVIEGMAIAAYAIGAERGLIYCRSEYPSTIQTMETAIEQAYQLGLLGKNILGSDFTYEMDLARGAGAFVCGEEGALMESIMGRRGEPRVRPPFPSIRGLWAKPTNINNVETLANVPHIILHGAEWYAGIGMENCSGTKTFVVIGDVEKPGIIEVAFGTTLREVIYDICGGIKGGKQLKAIQIDGPMGGCLPSAYLDMPISYDSMQAVGSLLGAGGILVLDEDTCMVDLARYFMEFTQGESCGKCNPCRNGTTHMLEILTRICHGQGRLEDLDMLEWIGEYLPQVSFCGMGQAAPEPVLSAMKFFRDEFEAHAVEHVCPVHHCRMPIHAMAAAA